MRGKAVGGIRLENIAESARGGRHAVGRLRGCCGHPNALSVQQTKEGLGSICCRVTDVSSAVELGNAKRGARERVSQIRVREVLGRDGHPYFCARAARRLLTVGLPTPATTSSRHFHQPEHTNLPLKGSGPVHTQLESEIGHG